jgi:hypothetical protein
MNRHIRLWLCVGSVMLLTIHQLPAPIQEVPESPTPEQSTKPKPKRTTKPNASENSEASGKRPTPSPKPKNQASPIRDLFDGRWMGRFENAEFTLTITGKGTSVSTNVLSENVSTNPATYNGRSMRWTRGWAYWTLAPNPDGTTALVNIGFDGFVEGQSRSSVIFRRVLP